MQIEMSYPTKATVVRLVKAAEAAGIAVASLHIKPDGTIVILDKTESPRDDFQRWQESKASTTSADA